MAALYVEEDSDFVSYNSISSSDLYADRPEIFRRKPEQIRFIWICKENNTRTQKDYKLEEFGLDPYSCGYLGRGRTISDDCNSMTANAAFAVELKEKYKNHTFTTENGQIICIQVDKCLSDSEAEKWQMEVATLFKAVNTVKTYKKSFPEKQENFDIVKKKLNHHLKESVVIAYTCDDPTNTIEIIFAYEDKHVLDTLVTLTDDMDKQSITRQSLVLQPDETKSSQILDALKFAPVDSKLDGDSVHVIGFEEDINNIMVKIRSLSSFKKEKVVYLHEEELTILKMNAANTFIKKQIKKLSDRPDLGWILDGNVVRIVGPDEETVNSCAECVKACFESRTFKEIHKNVLSSRTYKLELDRLQQRFNGKFILTCFNDTIKITSTSDIHEDITKKIEQFLERFIPDSVTIKSDSHKLDFLEESCRVSDKNVFQDELFQIRRKSRSEVQIDGTTHGINEVRKVFDNISIRVDWVARADIIHFLQSEEGSRLIRDVEDKCVCNVRIGHRDVDIQVVMGNIEEKRADVIVNSAAPDLTLQKGEVATCLSKTAGAVLQKDIQSQYPKGVEEGKVVKGEEVGRLLCKRVYHAVPAMGVAEKNAIETVKTMMNECLAMANEDEYRSIVFPVLGTGSLNYPPDKVAPAMYDVVTKFALESALRGTTLKEISIILFPKNSKVIKAFEAVTKAELRRTNDCRKKSEKLYTKPDCLLSFYVRFASDSKENIEKAARFLEQRLP
ncbi:hypothetical protein ACJMK2_005160 [Sinanodonta woodiana]|uniref:Macro domain-containing protein n=1 Tax=Sinanodonta woodiana TaxID=1069815 RepID=A0ABD3VQS3_SINWO